MTIKDDFKVDTIPSNQVKEWLKKKHYAKRMPMAVEHSFGIYRDSILQGVCVYGPSSPTVPLTLFGEHGKHKVRELTRLVVNEGLERGVLSFFVSQSLKLLPRPMCLVSFADKALGHHGYIYQATNWLYTGEGGGTTNVYDSNGKPVHNLTIGDGCEREHLTRSQYLKKYNMREEKAEPKYRYVYFLGSKAEVKQMKKDLKLPFLPYPKGDNDRYDNSTAVASQMTLF